MTGKDAEIINRYRKYVSNLNERFILFCYSFWLFEAIEEKRAPNVVGEGESDLNVRAFNNYKPFFTMSRHSLNYYFLSELAKLFDRDSQSLSFKKIINFCNANRKVLNVLCPSTSLIELEIKKIQPDIDVLIGYRDKYLAHDDLKKKDFDINRDGVLKVISSSEKFFKTLGCTTDYLEIKEESQNSLYKLTELMRSSI
ncbi:MAG TPA: hypothetical protein PLF31_01850 [Candidatus Paceibacterota bacterium]|nr:hypothetical protein [Candidatus Paceibacterota bacterium]